MKEITVWIPDFAWRQIATRFGIGRAEQDSKAPAFQVTEYKRQKGIRLKKDE